LLPLIPADKKGDGKKRERERERERERGGERRETKLHFLYRPGMEPGFPRGVLWTSAIVM